MTSTDVHTEDALKSFYLIGIVLTATFLANIISTKKWNVYFPESGATMVFGIIIGGVMELVRYAQIQKEFRFESETFYFILLPPIIFEAGYNMKKKDFFLNMVTILFYAVLGTLISTLVIGYGLYGIANIGLIKSISSEDMLAFLQFGALISATDPVATLSIMGSSELRVNPLVYSLIFGESVLNDAIAIVLFRTFNDFTGTTFGPIDALIALGQFVLISLGSIVIGVGVGLIAAIISFFRKLRHMFFLTFYILKHVKHLKDEPYMEVSIVVSLAYASYLLAEVAGLSGVMSLFLSGICMKHYAWYNLSEYGQVTTDQFFKMLAFLSETFVFVYVGLNVFGYTSELKWDPLLIFWATVFIFIARAFNIVPMSLLANIRRKTKITWRMQVMLWFAGLRGAIAFSLAQTVQSPNRPVIITTTLFIVLFTTLILGPLTAPVLKKLKLQQDLNPEDAEHAEALLLQSIDLTKPDPAEKLEVVHSEPVPARNRTAFHRYWRLFDDKVMKPLVGGKPRITVQ